MLFCPTKVSLIVTVIPQHWSNSEKYLASWPFIGCPCYFTYVRAWTKRLKKGGPFKVALERWLDEPSGLIPCDLFPPPHGPSPPFRCMRWSVRAKKALKQIFQGRTLNKGLWDIVQNASGIFGYGDQLQIFFWTVAIQRFYTFVHDRPAFCIF